ncbi:hypothetical protein GCM10009646_08080 [Streptomyces aureus]
MDDQVIAINENPRHRLTSPFLGSPAVEITGHDHRQPAKDRTGAGAGAGGGAGAGAGAGAGQNGWSQGRPPHRNRGPPCTPPNDFCRAGYDVHPEYPAFISPTTTQAAPEPAPVQNAGKDAAPRRTLTRRTRLTRLTRFCKPVAALRRPGGAWQAR